MAGEDPFAALRGAQQKQQQGGASENATQPQTNGSGGDTKAPVGGSTQVETPVANDVARDAGASTATAVRKPRLLSRPEKITGYVSSDMKALLADLAHRPRATGKYPKGEAEVIAWFLDLGRKAWEAAGSPPMP